MLTNIPYNRDAVLEYAKKWALSRNPKYLNFDNMGGDCTNFASQCIYAGCGVMNYTPVYGWYYIDGNRRSPSWTGVQFLYNFLINNKSVGPYAVLVDRQNIQAGDIVQLGDANNRFYHTPVVTGIRDGRIYVAAHTFDVYMRPLDTYVYSTIRYLHILGARKYTN
ncbi:MAG TPA: amidase domain-containing protein [Clostridiales bacterium]|nr:amidase domain-containing protein [Clostridiales bacterium]